MQKYSRPRWKNEWSKLCKSNVNQFQWQKHWSNTAFWSSLLYTWFIPAFVKSRVGSSCGTTDEDLTNVCWYLFWKNSMKIRLKSSPVNVVPILTILLSILASNPPVCTLRTAYFLTKWKVVLQQHVKLPKSIPCWFERNQLVKYRNVGWLMKLKPFVRTSYSINKISRLLPYRGRSVESSTCTLTRVIETVMRVIAHTPGVAGYCTLKAKMATWEVVIDVYFQRAQLLMDVMISETW